MRLSLLAALGFTAFLGIMTINAPDANARARSTTVVSGPRGTAVVTRSRGMRTATVVRRGRGIRTATVVRGARGAAVVCRSVIVNGVRVRRCR
jgi:hypothetical protein